MVNLTEEEEFEFEMQLEKEQQSELAQSKKEPIPNAKEFDISPEVSAKGTDTGSEFMPAPIEGSQYNPSPLVVREAVEEELPTKIAEGLGLGGKIGLGIITTLPTGFKGNVASAAMFGGIDALEESIKSMSYGEDVPEAMGKGLKTGATSAGIELASGAIFKGLSSIKKPFLKSGEKIAKSKAAKEAIEGLQSTKRFFANKNNLFKNRLLQSTEKVKKRMDVDIKNITSQIDNLTNISDELTISLNKKTTDSIGKVKRFISSQYDEILDGSTGEIPVNIDMELNEIANSLNLKSFNGGAKKKLTTIIEALRSQDVDVKAISELQELAAKKPEDSVNIILRDAHWLKKALRSIGDNLKKDPISKELGFNIVGISKRLGKNIDDQIGGKYADVSNRWREMMQVEEAVDTSVGRLRTLFGETKRKGRQKVQNKIIKAAKEGNEITEDMIREQDETIEALFSQAELLERNGFDDTAFALRENLSELSSSLVKRQKLKTTKDMVLKLAKDTGNENAIALNNIISNIERETGKSFEDLVSGTTKKTQKNLIEYRKRIRDLSNRKKKIAKLYPEKARKIDDEIYNLKKSLIDPEKGLLREMMTSGALMAPLVTYNILDPKLAVLIPASLALKKEFPRLSYYTGKFLETKIAKAALSENARRSSNRIVSYLINDEENK